MIKYISLTETGVRYLTTEPDLVVSSTGVPFHPQWVRIPNRHHPGGLVGDCCILNNAKE